MASIYTTAGLSALSTANFDRNHAFYWVKF